MKKLSLPPAAVMLLLPLSCLNAGPVFSWSDARGITHFSDTPPDDGTLEVRQIEDLPPPSAGSADDSDFYSVARQLERMQARRLLDEKMKAERLRAEAEASRARAEALAAQQAILQQEPEPVRYFYPYYPYHKHRHPHRHHSRPGDKPEMPGKPEHRHPNYISRLPPPVAQRLTTGPSRGVQHRESRRAPHN